MTNNVSFVSIVIPTLNDGATLKNCLESIMRVDYPQTGLEIILVDGGSTDQTVQVAGNYPIRVLTEPKKIRGATYNRGLKEASGEYVAYVDGDGFVSEKWLKEGLRIFHEQPDCAAVYFHSEVPKEATLLQRIIGVYQLKGKLLAVDVREHAGAGANGAIYRKRLIESVGGFDEKLAYGQERELDFRLHKNGYNTATGPRNLVFHYPKSSLYGFFAQSLEGGAGYLKRFYVVRKKKMLVYMVLRAAMALLPAFAIVLFWKSPFLFDLFVVAGTAFSIAYAIYLRHSTRYKDKSLLLALPLAYISCVASLVGYVVGLGETYRHKSSFGERSPT